MIYKPICFLLLLISLFALGSCNSDIFIDGPALPDEAEAVIEGDGGEASFTIPLKGLKYISIDRISESARYYTWYNKAGEEIPEYSPASELGKIVCETAMASYQLTVDGNRLHFESLENTTGHEIDVTIRLEYDYATKFIIIRMLPGASFDLESIDYNEGLWITEVADIRVRTMTFTTNGSIPQVMSFMPYINIQPTSVVEPEVSWVKYRTVDMSLPKYKDGEWKLMPVMGVNIGSPVLLGFDRYDEEVEVSVPAKSTIRVICKVTILSAEKTGTFVFRNPTSGRRHDVRFSCKTTWPTGYITDIEDEK